MSKMKLSLALGADANESEFEASNCWIPLIAAVEANQPEAVHLLLERGADVNKKLKRGQTALMTASYHGDTGMIRLLT
jgi:ankyrin repeat protein